jgi:hypothetical protein
VEVVTGYDKGRRFWTRGDGRGDRGRDGGREDEGLEQSIPKYVCMHACVCLIK